MIECKTWKSYQIGQLGFRQRCLWIGLITTADDQGRGHAHPGIVRGAVFPYDDLSNSDLQEDMDALADLGLIILYAGDNGQPLYQVVNWWRYQRPTWAWPSDLPPPDGWIDRERYRRGNEVIQSNWDDDGGLADDESEPTMGPERGQDGPTVKRAPSGRYSGSSSDSDSSRGSGADDDNAFTRYQAAGGILTAITADRIKALIQEFEEHRYTIPPPAPGSGETGEQWVMAAIEEAAACATRGISVKYVSSILDRWKREGFRAPFRGGKNGKHRGSGPTCLGAGEGGADHNTPSPEELEELKRLVADHQAKQRAKEAGARAGV